MFQKHGLQKLIKTTRNIKVIPGYQPYCSTKGSSLNSGCRFFVNEGSKFIERNDLNEGNEFQPCWTETVNDNKPNVIARLFYRHPRKNYRDEFVENLKATLNKIKSKNKNMNILMSFLIQCLNTCLLYNRPSLVHDRPSLIDKIFVNKYDK